MSDLGDDFRAMKDFKRKMREKEEPRRMKYAEERLGVAGCSLSSGPDPCSYHVTTLDGREFNVWPYSGYWAGPTQGRGIGNFLKEIRKSSATGRR